MKYTDPELQKILAGKYALGALQGLARRRFERLMRRDRGLRLLVHQWQADLAPLAEETAAVKPPPRVFAAVKRRIENQKPGAQIESLWGRLGFWHALSGAATTAAVVLALTAIFLWQKPPVAASPNYVAILQDQAARPAVVVTAYKAPFWRLSIESLATPALGTNQVLQVWAVEKDSGTMRPLVAFSPGGAQTVALKEQEWRLVKTAHSLAITIEPGGVTPASPTTPVLYSGLCINLRGS